jgi:hypothetical protein
VKPQLKEVSGPYGAPMGRPNVGPIDPDNPTKWYLSRIPLNHQGYDSGGAYWGTGRPLFWALQSNPADGEAAEELFFRAVDRAAAKEHILSLNPNSKFLR